MIQTQRPNELPQQKSGEPPIVTLCRWLTALDGWAAFYELDPNAEQQPSREKMSATDRAQSLYLLKEQALLALYATESPTVQLGILTGPSSKNSLWLCADCRSKARSLRMSPKEYAEVHGGCSQCQRSGDSDYFSLYQLLVDYEPLGEWRFYTPVPLGREYFPQPRSKQAPVIGPRPTGDDGRFAPLTTPLSKQDRKVYPESEVVYQVWTALRAVKEGTG